MVGTPDHILLRNVIWAGNKDSLAALHAKYYLGIERFIASCINSTQDAEDLAQNVFVELLQGNCRYDGHYDPQAYLLGMAKNVIRRFNKIKKKQPIILPLSLLEKIAGSSVASSADNVSNPNASRQVLYAAEIIAKLAPKAREAIRLKFIDGLSSKEAARCAGCSTTVFYSRVYDGLSTLRRPDNSNGTQLEEAVAEP